MSQPQKPAEPKKPTQEERLLRHLKAFGIVNPLQSWTQLGIYRLAASVHRLRAQGHPITTKMVEVRNRWNDTITVAQYELEGVLPPPAPEPAPEPIPEPAPKQKERARETAQQTFPF